LGYACGFCLARFKNNVVIFSQILTWKTIVAVGVLAAAGLSGGVLLAAGCCTSVCSALSLAGGGLLPQAISVVASKAKLSFLIPFIFILSLKQGKSLFFS
jgi:hypothetical protein